MKRTTTYGILALACFFLLGTVSMISAKKDRSDTPWIGVSIQTIDEDIREAFDLESDVGVLINEVIDNSPADEAGLRPKDIVLDINGEKVTDSKEFKEMILNATIGDKLEFRMLRRGQEKQITVEVGEQNDDIQNYSKSWSFSAPKVLGRMYGFSAGSDAQIGVAIQNLNEQLGDYFGVANGEGVLVTEVFEDSPAEKAGIKAGDVIIAADDDEIVKTDDLQEIIGDKEDGDTVTITYLRRGDKNTATIEVSEDFFGSRPGMSQYNFFAPGVQHSGNLFDHFFLDKDLDTYRDAANDYKIEMKKLQEEMNQLNKELQDIKKRLD